MTCLGPVQVELGAAVLKGAPPCSFFMKAFLQDFSEGTVLLLKHLGIFDSQESNLFQPDHYEV